MPFQRRRPWLVLTEEIRARLDTIRHSRTESARRMERAKILLSYVEGSTISSIARGMNTNHPKVERCVDKTPQLGALMVLQDVEAGPGYGIEDPLAIGDSVPQYPVLHRKTGVPSFDKKIAQGCWSINR